MKYEDPATRSESATPTEDIARAEVLQSLAAIESAVRTLRQALQRLWTPGAPDQCGAGQPPRSPSGAASPGSSD